LLYNGPLLCGFNVPIKGLSLLLGRVQQLTGRIGRTTGISPAGNRCIFFYWVRMKVVQQLTCLTLGHPNELLNTPLVDWVSIEPSGSRLTTP